MRSGFKVTRLLLFVAIVGGFIVSMGAASLRVRQQLFNSFLVGVASGSVVSVLKGDR